MAFVVGDLRLRLLRIVAEVRTTMSKFCEQRSELLVLARSQSAFLDTLVGRHDTVTCGFRHHVIIAVPFYMKNIMVDDRIEEQLQPPLPPHKSNQQQPQVLQHATHGFGSEMPRETTTGNLPDRT